MYQIRESLLLDSHPEGAVLVFTSSDVSNGAMDIYQIGMNRRTLNGCKRALESRKLSWVNNGRSLCVKCTPTGDITLVFLDAPGATVTLSPEESAAFEEAISSLSEEPQA